MNVHTEFKDLLNVFNHLIGCKIEYPFKGNSKRAMIASANPVPWESALKPQYNEMQNKIGYIDEQNKGVRLDIDFLPQVLSEFEVQVFMDSYSSIMKVDDSTKSPLTKSYWRYKVEDNFNSFTLCLRNGELLEFDKESSEFMEMLQSVIDGLSQR